MGLSIFQTSTLGMKSFAHALNNIGSNIANVSTPGYKRTDTRFSTVLSNNLLTGSGAHDNKTFADQDRALGGVLPKSYQTLDQQGIMTGSTSNLDIGIGGKGFFQLSPTIATSNEIYFTRDGGFKVNIAGTKDSVIADDGNTIQVSKGYLADKNGNFLLGMAPSADGTFSPTGAIEPMRVDQYAFLNKFSGTTKATMQFNLPSTSKFEDQALSKTFPLVDSNGLQRNVTALFNKRPDDNQWLMSYKADNLTDTVPTPGNTFQMTTGTGTGKILKLGPGNRNISVQSEFIPSAVVPGTFQGLKVGDSISLTGTTANDGTYEISAIASDFGSISISAATPLLGGPETVTTAGGATSSRVVGAPLIFSQKGQIVSPINSSINLSWDNGATNTVALDLFGSTQLNGGFDVAEFGQNGLTSANMKEVGFDEKGHVVGRFSDGTSRIVYKVPLALFSNVNGLEARSGSLYEESSLSGTRSSVFVDTGGIATIHTNSLELSNVDLATQFTQMIQVQQAYNSSATVFKTVDELITTARDLKR
jgi:flagellar hook protein FlgE